MMLISLLSAPAYADEPLGPISGLDQGYQTTAGVLDPLTTAETLLSNIVGFLTVVGGLLFLIYTILAGLTWITAREEAERLSKAKQVFMNALIGLALVVAAWSIAGIFQTIFGFNILSPSQYLEKISPGRDWVGGGGGYPGGGGGHNFD